MAARLEVRNESRRRRRLHDRRNLGRLADRVLAGEGVRGDVELSLLLCDDSRIQELNAAYRGKNRATDVLSFAQTSLDDAKANGDGRRVLGDVVISLETVEQHCQGDRTLMREEVRLLFCHGLLHLLGYDHHTAKDERAMRERQTRYLEIDSDRAWLYGPRGKD